MRCGIVALGINDGDVEIVDVSEWLLLLLDSVPAHHTRQDYRIEAHGAFDGATILSRLSAEDFGNGGTGKRGLSCDLPLGSPLCMELADDGLHLIGRHGLFSHEGGRGLFPRGWGVAYHRPKMAYTVVGA